MTSLTNSKTKVALLFGGVVLMLIIRVNVAASGLSPLPTPTPGGCLPATTTAWENNRVIYQEFPARGPTETTWLIVWTKNVEEGLWIANAWFKPKPTANFIAVLGQSGPSQIFVPYHDGLARLYDLNPWTDIHEAVQAYTGPCGTISGPFLPPNSQSFPSLNSPPEPILIKEIRDRGIAWTSDGHLRRGEELLLWSVIDTGNYEYVVQYGFRDDGTITFRMGSTGYNSPVTPFESHMHDTLWYVDVNVGQANHNTVSVMRHLEPAPNPSPSPNPLYQATDVMQPFNNGLEGFEDWQADQFTGLNIQDTLTKNARGHNISYDLMPMRTGSARHAEDFTRHDFWVTRRNPNEMTYEWGFEGPAPYITPAQSIVDTDVVIWCMTSNHHHPRDEDHEFDAMGNQLPGVAQVMWSGFDLHPRNLMDDAPLYACAKVPTGLVAWWPFEESSGAHHVGDIKTPGTPNNGTPHPGPLGPASSTNPTWTGPTPVTGAVGGALSFDGVDDYVSVNNDPSLNFGVGDFSIDTWIRAPATSGGVILDKRVQIGPKYQGYHVFLSNGKPGLQLANAITYANYVANTTVADAYWHHLAITVNRNGATKEIRWYVDGNLVDTTPAPLAGSVTNASPLNLGVRSFQLNGFLKGSLGETELFNRVLTPAEIKEIYAQGKCR